MVPPTPGPLTAAGMLGVDTGKMILAGAGMSIPIFIAGVVYARWIGTRIYQFSETDDAFTRKEFCQGYIRTLEQLESVKDTKELPELWNSLEPIVVPLLLILCRTGLSLTPLNGGMLYEIINLLGAPIVALTIGTMLAVYGLGCRFSKEEVMRVLNDSIRDTGIIMLITGAGGALGNVIKVSGIGDALGAVVIDWPIPVVLIPVIIAALMRIALGSATVAITKAASLTAPIVSALGVNSVLLAQACCIGALSFSYFNDSGFWVFNGMFGLTELKDQLRCKTAVSMIMTGVGITELLILNILLI